ncbi:MAG: phosphotransferase [Patescibacteria group bacterium]
MKQENYSGLNKAFSSQVRIEKRDGKEIIIKQINAQESQSEVFFHDQLKSIGLPAMEMALDSEGLAITFIPGAITLGDNETPELYKKLGHILKKIHSITFDKPFFLDANGQQQEVAWDQFVKNRLEFAITRQKQRNGMSEDICNLIKKIVLKKVTIFSGKPALLHGDLHSNNVLLKGSDLFVFDKAAQIMAGDPMYDLSLFAIALSGALYGVSDSIERDKLLMSAFISGYDTDFTEDKDLFNAYVLFRCVERWPNPFEQEIPQIVESILLLNSA